MDNERGRKLKKIRAEIMEFKLRCRVNFGGFWELDHASYQGDILDLDSTTYRRWKNILFAVNHVIAESKDD